MVMQDDGNYVCVYHNLSAGSDENWDTAPYALQYYTLVTNS